MAKLNLLKLKSAKSQAETFKKEHPALIDYGSEIWQNAIESGAVFTLKTQTQDGRSYETAFTLTQFDVDFVKGLFK